MSGERIRKNVGLWGMVWGLLGAFMFYIFHFMGLSEIHSAIVVLSMILGGFGSLFESRALDIVSALKENE